MKVPVSPPASLKLTVVFAYMYHCLDEIRATDYAMCLRGFTLACTSTIRCFYLRYSVIRTWMALLLSTMFFFFFLLFVNNLYTFMWRCIKGTVLAFLFRLSVVQFLGAILGNGADITYRSLFFLFLLYFSPLPSATRSWIIVVNDVATFAQATKKTHKGEELE